MELERLFFYDVLPNLITVFIIMYFLLFFSMKYSRISREKSRDEMKKHTLKICFDDNKNYYKILNSLKYSSEIGSIEDFLNVLDYFEKIAIGIENKVLDEGIIFNYYGAYFSSFFQEYRYFSVGKKLNWDKRYFHLEKIVQHFSNKDTFESR